MDVDYDFKEFYESFNAKLSVAIDKARLDLIFNNTKGFEKRKVHIHILGHWIKIPFIYKKVHHDYSKQAELLRKNGINSYEDLVEFRKKGGTLE